MMKIWKTKISVKVLILLLLLQTSYIFKAFMKALNVWQISKENQTFAIILAFTRLRMQCGIDSSIFVLVKSIFWIGYSLFSILRAPTSPVNHSWMLVGAIRISSFFSLWKLDYFSGIACLKNPLSDMISCFPQPI